MAEPVLFVPGYGVSPRACEEVPAFHAALERFREVFEVTVFHWPSVKGGPDFPPTWEGAAAALGQVLPSARHLVTTGGNITYALVGMKGIKLQLRSIVTVGFDIPVATLNALGLHSLARAAEANSQIDASNAQQSSRIFMQGADDVVAGEIMRRMYQDTKWMYMEAFTRHTQRLNLVEQAPAVHTPTLFLESGLALPGWEQRDVFIRFLPETDFVEMDSWQLHEPDSGRAFADLAVPFMQKHSGRVVLTTLLVADIVDSTVQAATLGGPRWSQVLDRFHALANRELQSADGKLVDTAGDGFLAVFEDPGAAIRCAAAVSRKVADLGVETRSGVHTGQVEVSGEKYSGVAVHTAARVAAKAAPSEVLVSETVRKLLAGSATTFEDRGAHELKGIAEPVQLYAAGV